MNNSFLRAEVLTQLPEISGAELPRDIQVFPPGREVEFTLQDHPGQTFTMTVDEAVAAKAQEDLARMHAAEAVGSAPTPFADKNHEDAEATFHPVRFFWAGEDPKAGGVRVAAKWTPFGAALVRAKAFKYFSGNFLFNKTTKKFLGLINENIGGLVNRPGFGSLQAFAKAGDSIVDFDIKSAIRALNKKHGVSVPLDSVSPLEEAATQLASARKTLWISEFSRLVALQPELARYGTYCGNGIDPEAQDKLEQEIQSLSSKEGAEALAAAAKSYQRTTGLLFEESWNTVCAAARAGTSDERIAAAIYQRALELRYSNGLTFVEAHARATTEFSGTAPDGAPSPSEKCRLTMHAFQTHARALADSIRPGIDQQEAERIFAGTDAGRWLYAQV